ncbi:MAG: LysM peptidoglycan-binding domain-containing protein [Bacteroidales bacterium]|nr:LysM peptidoglycan-binding domain-containing protein [Bacteroidales bacterium]
MERGAIRLIISLIAAAVMSSGFAEAVYAQEYESTPVTISKEKLKINGQVCYSHIVLEKQTLFSISKAYNVTIEDIYKYNPSAKEKGLQKNSILIIPVVEKPEQQEIEATEEKEAYAEGQVQQEQQEQPVRNAEDQVKKEEGGKAASEQTVHIRKWYEDLDMIARKYGVTVESIMKANGLKGRKLSNRQRLIIPSSSDAVPEEEIPSENDSDKVAASDTTQTDDSTTAHRPGILEGLFFPKKDISMSLILPLKATGTSASAGNMDFYSGVLLAVYDAGEAGTGCDLAVYDCADGRGITKESLEGRDFIIGPVSRGDLTSALELGTDTRAIISPLDQKAASLTGEFTNMIQAPTPLEIQYKDLMDWIREDMQYSDRFVVITEKGAVQTEVTTQMKAAADSSGMEYKNLSYSILEGRNVTGSLEYIMTESGTNRVYIASDSEAFVNDVVRNLNLMIHKKYEVVLYAPSRIRSYETIEVENFHNTSLKVSTGYYIDYEDPRVQEFLLKYRALFNAEPTQFAFQGYDLAKFFIGMTSKYGNRWMNKLEESDASMLQSTYRFRKDGNGGYVNTGVRRIVYNEGWIVSKVR